VPISLPVAAPPGVVFDYLVDPRNRPEWQSSLRSVEVLDDGPVRLHLRWIDHTIVGARPRLAIAELRPPSDEAPGVWREVGRWRGLAADLTLRFTPVDSGTRLDGSVALTGPLPVRLVLQLLAPRAIVADLRRAARILEAQA
jgi:hypothetical protein